MPRTIPRNTKNRTAATLAVLLAAALAVRILFLVELERSEFGDLLSLDSQLYFDLARDISSGGALPRDAITFNPLYPAFLVVTFKLFGVGLLAPRIIQCLIGLLTVALVYAAARRLAPHPPKGKRRGELAATVAAATAVLYAGFVLYDGMLLASTLEVFFFTAAFALTLALDDDLKGTKSVTLAGRRVPPWVSSLLLGAFLGAGALGRPNIFLLLIAALPLWLLARHRAARGPLASAAAILAGAAILMAPVIIRNAQVTGRFVPITASGGLNFFVGNGPGSTGLYQAPLETRSTLDGVSKDARTKAETETGRSMTQAETSAYYFRAAIDHIVHHPAEWLRLMGKKLMLYFNTDAPGIPHVALWNKTSRLLRLLFVPYAVIVPLALCGFLILMLGGRYRSVVALFGATAVASVIIFFVTARYRLPATPLFIILAALFVDWAAREIAGRRIMRIAGMSALAAALFISVSNRHLVEENETAVYALLGTYYARSGDEEKAEEAFAEAYRLAPSTMGAIVNYARILRQRGRQAEAADLFARAHEQDPRYPLIAVEYGMALDRLGRHEEAKRLFLEASGAARPTERALACRLLARTAMASGDREEAIRWIRKALVEVPGEPQLTEMLRRLESAEAP